MWVCGTRPARNPEAYAMRGVDYRAKDSSYYYQYRGRAGGRVEVEVASSRDTKRAVLPQQETNDERLALCVRRVHAQ